MRFVLFNNYFLLTKKQGISIFARKSSHARSIYSFISRKYVFGSGVKSNSTSRTSSSCLFSNEVNLKKTCLYDFHVSQEGKMVPFAGYLMPVQYGNHGIAASHLHTRKYVSIFDVSHMLQSKLHGKDRVKFIESLIVGDIQGLKEDQGTLTLYTNEKGGIIDDLIVTKTSQGYLYIVSNAGCIDKDLAHVKKHLTSFQNKGGDVELEVIMDRALLAVQGPGMSSVLQPLVTCNLNQLTFMTSVLTSLCGVPDCRITRCGYTGEDGVEISIPSESASVVLEKLLQSPNVLLAGLGARDTLRLEAGLCLYGNDICDDTTPIQAGLTWTIGKRRREDANFPGASIILKELKDKPISKRVGLVSSGPPARAHTPVLSASGEVIGEVTSGGPSPCLKTNVAMAYVKSAHAKPGTKLILEVRKRSVDAEVSKMPFVPSKYFTGK